MTSATIAIHKYVYDGATYHVAWVNGVASTGQSTWFDAFIIGLAMALDQGMQVEATSQVLKTARGDAAARALIAAAQEILQRGDEIYAERFDRLVFPDGTSRELPERTVAHGILPGETVLILSTYEALDWRVFTSMDAIWNAVSKVSDEEGPPPPSP